MVPAIRGTHTPGSLPEASARELMMGMKMPPARAVVEGIAGARTASAMDRPYARPSVLFPQAATNMLATRSPSPVFWKPCSMLQPWVRVTTSVRIAKDTGALLSGARSSRWV